MLTYRPCPRCCAPLLYDLFGEMGRKGDSFYCTGPVTHKTKQVIEGVLVTQDEFVARMTAA